MLAVLEKEVRRLTEAISDEEKARNRLIPGFLVNIEKILLRLKARQRAEKFASKPVPVSAGQREVQDGK